MADEDEPWRSNTPWRRDSTEVGPPDRVGARAVGPDASVVERRRPGNGMSSETVLFDVRRPAGALDRYVARLAPLPDAVSRCSPSTTSSSSANACSSCAAHTDVPAPEVACARTRLVVARHAVPRHAPRRRRSRRPTSRPTSSMGGCSTPRPSSAPRCSATRVDVLARLHELTPDDARPRVPRRGPSTAPTRSTSSSATSAGTTSGRARVRAYPLIERTFAWLDEHRPAEGDARCSTGATPASATCCTATSSRSRCSTGRWRRSARARSTSRG